MKWQEVRALFPNQFVLFEIIESHVAGNKEYIDDVAVIKAIPDGKKAMKEFMNCKSGQLVYSTKNEEGVIHLVKNTGIRINV